GTILFTTNGGATWTGQTSGTSNSLYGVSFVDTSHGWAVGSSGTILAYTNPPPAGTMSASPSSGAPGTVISAWSATPCPAGSGFAKIYLLNGSGKTVASKTAGNFD